MGKQTGVAAALALLLGGLTAQQAVMAATEAQAATLGKELTPVGAEMAANKDGSVPAWTGGELKAPGNWKPGAARPDPYAADNALLKAGPVLEALARIEPPRELIPEVATFLEVEGAGDYLPPYSGNLDIMTAAATKVGEEIARELQTEGGGGA